MSGSDPVASNGAHRLVDACFESRAAAAALLDAEPDLLHARTSLGETALHYLVVENQLEAVRWLLERGASLDVLSDLMISPLSEAASLGHAALVDWLLDQGAALDVPGQCSSALASAAASGDVTIVRRVLAAKADVEATDRHGQTALHVACRDDARLHIVEMLLAAAAPLNARQVNGKTPLDVAIDCGASRIESFLRVRGAASARNVG